MLVFPCLCKRLYSGRLALRWAEIVQSDTNFRMMTPEIKYRLHEYVIIEHGGILLTWVSHTALGEQLSGRCYIVCNILVIGPPEHEEPGFLKLEFHEQLIKFPPWVKTTFYCFASFIRKVGIEQSIINDLKKIHISIKKLTRLSTQKILASFASDVTKSLLTLTASFPGKPFENWTE